MKYKPSEKEKLRKKCVKLAKDIVKKKANYTCEKCTRNKDQVQQQGSHIYPEGRYRSMSADIDNILCLCAGCHMWSSDSWHENPLESAEWFHQKYPARYELLKERSRSMPVCDLYYWEQKLKELKEYEKKIH